MKILVIGDVFGFLGRKIIEKKLSQIKQQEKIDLVIANIENVTNGRGISWEHYLWLKNIGIDLMTSGNHIFDQKETISFIKDTKDLIRPLNSNPYHPGNGSTLFLWTKKRIRLTNLLGTALMPSPGDNPFFALENLLKKEKDWDIHLVDFHAQATAEKKVLAWEFDGKVSAIWGTHTHVATADEEIMPKGTAYITDIGMTGPAQGIIGADPIAISTRSKLGFPAKIIPYEKGQSQLNSIILEINDKSNKVVSIKRFFLKD